MVRVQIKGGVWKNTEDEILKAAISKYGMNQWARISSLLVRKTPKQCKARWYEWLDPAIKKTEWSKEEDEKLLHLAKLMPTQWRTIAPIVGRTATQCLERYQRLLDEAEEQDRQAGGDAGPSKFGLTGIAGPEAAPSAEDVRRLRPGEIDPDPESKPARPDPIDMDEDEKEMLSEARARLANTQGKKAKRKARERALEEARRLAILQKRRELKAAGVVMRGPKAKKGEVDYNADIPFEKQPVKGFYDTSNEVSKSYQAPIGQKLGHMERKRKPGEEDDAKKKKNKEEKKKADPFNENSEQVRRLKEAEQISKRRKLMLPEAQVGERELEEIVKLGQAGESARELVAGGESTEGLLASYDSLQRAKMARTPRTAPEDDAVMREARNLRNMTASQTPLLGDANIPMEQGLGHVGATPRSSVPETPNPLLTPAHHGGRPIAGPGETPMSSRGSMISATPRGMGGPSATPLRTPLRDNLGLYDDDTSSILDATPFDEKRARMSAKSELLASLRNLPQPSNNFEFVLDEEEDEEEDDDDYEAMISISEDTADRDARLNQEREEAQRKALARRSRVVKMGLPRPPNVDAPALLASLNLSDASPAERLVLREMVQLMKHDSIVHPIAGSKAVGGLRSDLPLLSDDAMDDAREEVRAELARTVGFPGAKEDVLKRMIGARLQADEVGQGGEDGKLLDEALSLSRERVSWSADRQAWVSRRELSAFEYKRGQAALLDLAKEQMTEAAVAASKEEKRLAKILGGYQGRSKSLATTIREGAEQLSTAGVELAAFERLAGGEGVAAQERLAKLEEEVRTLERREEQGQSRYKELDELRRTLRDRVKALEEERDLREAEKINEEALAQLNGDGDDDDDGPGEEEDMGPAAPPSNANGITA